MVYESLNEHMDMVDEGVMGTIRDTVRNPKKLRKAINTGANKLVNASDDIVAIGKAGKIVTKATGASARFIGNRINNPKLGKLADKMNHYGNKIDAFNNKVRSARNKVIAGKTMAGKVLDFAGNTFGYK